MDWSACLEHAVLSDVGMRRANNQDSAIVVIAPDEAAWRRRGHLFVVADGMGAHAAGELASKMAADGIPHNYHKLLDQPPPYALAKAIEEINDQINQRGQANLDFQGMGTTSSVLLLLPQGALVAHVGDSRVYRLRGTQLEQLTFDHSLLWEMRKGGQLDPDALATLVPKNIITRSLGPHPHVQVDMEGPFPLEVGDAFLLCSDGLTGQVRDHEIGAILSCLAPGDAVQALVELANLRGGPDNITVIVARVASDRLTRSTEPLAVKTGDLVAAQRVHPALWIVAGVAALVAFGLALGGQFTAAVGLAFIAVLSATVGLVKRFGAGVGTFYLKAGTRLGNGPHVTCDATPDQVVVDELAHIVGQLEQAANGEQWQVDWNQFRDLVGRARADAEKQDFSQAVRQYAEAMSFMMSQLRKRRGTTSAVADSEQVDL